MIKDQDGPAAISGTGLLDWPITLADLQTLRKGRRWALRITGFQACQAIIFQVIEYGTPEAGLQGSAYRAHGDQFPSRAMARGSCQQIGFCFQGLQVQVRNGRP